MFVIRRMRKGIFIVILVFCVVVMIPLRVVLLAVLQKNIFFILMTTGIQFSFKYFAYHFYSYINIILYMSVLRVVSVRVCSLK